MALPVLNNNGPDWLEKQASAVIQPDKLGYTYKNIFYGLDQVEIAAWGKNGRSPYSQSKILLYSAVVPLGKCSLELYVYK